MRGENEVEAFLGVDWGTHSSKWACWTERADGYLQRFPLHSSDLYRSGGELVFDPHEVDANEENLIKRLKQVLINDPLGSDFWTAMRHDTQTSLGEAVAFSLVCLMAEAKVEIVEACGGPLDHLEVGFSFPNWLVERTTKHRIATKNFCEAAAVANHLVWSEPDTDLPWPGKPFPITSWRSAVNRARNELPQTPEGNLDETSMTQRVYGAGQNTWTFLTESAAAGLPYLRSLPATRLQEVPGLPGLGKFIVVDVGAGTTDIGYMLRVIGAEQHHESFYYFQPASSFPLAGNHLTEEIRRHYRITEAEAEARKLQRTDWSDLTFVREWRRSIANRAREYVETVPDRRWLPMPVSLNVVLTGGSGLVAGLREEVESALRDALNKAYGHNAGATVTSCSQRLPGVSFSQEAEYARRAVCLGTADPDKPGLKYMAKMDSPTQQPRITQGRRWV